MTQPLNSKLIILSKSAPPAICGVSDYSYQTAKSLSKFYQTIEIGVAELLPQHVNVGQNLSVESWQKLMSRVNASGNSTDLILNYTPVSYAFSGFAFQLIRALKQFKKTNPNNRLFVLFHETWNGNPNLRLHHLIRDRLTKWSIRKIVEMANGIAVPTDEQKRKLNDAFDLKDIHFSPIGTNILPENKDDGLISNRESGEWIVFGLAHSRLWTFQKYLELFKTLYQRGAIKKIYSIGPIHNTFSDQEAALISEQLDNSILVQLGALSAEEVSKRLLKAEVAVVGQGEDSLKKSSIFAAMAAHAVPIICDVSPDLQEPPGHLFIRSSELMENTELLKSEMIDQRRRALHEWFWKTRSWDAIGDNMREWIIKNS